MPRPTVRDLKAKVQELLDLQAAFERYKALEADIKADMAKLKYKEVKLETGRVFINTSERMTISPELAISALGEVLASKVIIIKKSVSNDILNAFIKAGEISEEQHQRLIEQADKKPVTSLYVRPLK